jgi:hypothetical protein
MEQGESVLNLTLRSPLKLQFTIDLWNLDDFCLISQLFN